MNKVEIKYSYFMQGAEVLINGESASPYNEIMTISNRPFWETALNVVNMLDSELCDDYEIFLYAPHILYQLLNSSVSEQNYCRSIYDLGIQSLYSDVEMIDKMGNIGIEYNVSLQGASKISVYNEVKEVVGLELDSVNIEVVPNADIGIFENLENISGNIRVPVVVSESFYLSSNNGRCVFGIPAEYVSEMIELYLTEAVRKPLLMEYMTALRYVIISDLHKRELEVMRSGVPSYYLGELPQSIDQGETVKIEFISFPEEYYVLHSDDSGVITCTQDSVTANIQGTGNLMVSYSEGVVETRTINVIGHRYVEEIKLIPRFQYLKLNERNVIDVILAPSNAEDINELTWEIQNPNVISIDGKGNIVALSAGITLVTASTRKAKGYIHIEVKPGVREIRISPQYVRLKRGEVAVVECDIYPRDAYVENLLWDIDNRTIASINPSISGKKCQIIASAGYEGKGNIRCKDADSKLGSICNIEVVSTETPNKIGNVALAFWLIGIIIPYLLPVSAGVSIYGLKTDEDEKHRGRYILCLIGSIITLMIWLC